MFPIVSLGSPRNEIRVSTNNHVLPLRHSFSCLIALAGTQRMLEERDPSIRASRSGLFHLILSPENCFLVWFGLVWFCLLIPLDGHTNMSGETRVNLSRNHLRTAEAHQCNQRGQGQVVAKGHHRAASAFSPEEP